MLESAIANARYAADQASAPFDERTLVVSEAYVDEGPTMKRFRPRAQGRASRINKRTSHITVRVAQPQKTTAEEATDGSEGQPERLPTRHHHRAQEPLVR
ncbi:hypothetical protein GCM10025872_06280 [Barrientosiimonas endolithica]|uniref:50S ribosomal protein L22 n=1 Tax=Barrientosiimonas endolithica TaxID=1535208 RepID=A0ABN6YLS2_9MICO|nr:hypothetical protein GCM10025872_06280 [Barrientosiimonas endolithica]